MQRLVLLWMVTLWRLSLGTIMNGVTGKEKLSLRRTFLVSKLLYTFVSISYLCFNMVFVCACYSNRVIDLIRHMASTKWVVFPPMACIVGEVRYICPFHFAEKFFIYFPFLLILGIIVSFFSCFTGGSNLGSEILFCFWFGIWSCPPALWDYTNRTVCICHL